MPGVGWGLSGARKDLESLCRVKASRASSRGASSRNSVGPPLRLKLKKVSHGLWGRIGEERIRIRCSSEG